VTVARAWREGLRLALQQHGVHALGGDRHSSNANSKQRNSECSVWFSHFRTADHVRTGNQYRPPQFPEVYWRDGRFASAPRRTTRIRPA